VTEQKDNPVWGDLRRGDLLVAEDKDEVLKPCYMLIISHLKAESELLICMHVFSGENENMIEYCVFSEKELTIPLKSWRYLSRLPHN